MRRKLPYRWLLFFQYANMLGVGHGSIRDERTYTGQNFTYLPKTIDYARKINLIPQKTGYPSNRLYKLDRSFRRNTGLIGRITWTFLPELLILFITIALYRYFPATAASSLLILSVFPPIFFIAALFNPMYYLFIFYGGLIIIPLMATEFRYRRYRKK
jgi:hypothetical protein